MKYIYSFILFVAFSSALTTSWANEPSWIPIEINKEASYLLDEQSISRDGYIANATLEIRLSKKQTIKDLIFDSASYVIQAQCINKIITPKIGSLNEFRHVKENTIRQDAITFYHKIAPISLDQKLIMHLCMN